MGAQNSGYGCRPYRSCLDNGRAYDDRSGARRDKHIVGRPPENDMVHKITLPFSDISASGSAIISRPIGIYYLSKYLIITAIMRT
jgi:hypothetical protein